MCLGERTFIHGVDERACFHPHYTFIRVFRKHGNGFPASKLVANGWGLPHLGNMEKIIKQYQQKGVKSMSDVAVKLTHTPHVSLWTILTFVLHR